MSNNIKILETTDSWMFINNTKSIWWELVENLIIFWFSFSPVIVPVYYFTRQESSIVRGGFLVIALWLITLIRRKTTYLTIFTLANAAVGGLVFITSFSLIEKIAFTAYVVIWILLSYKSKYEEVVEFLDIKVLLWGEVVLGVCFFAAYAFHLGPIETLLTYLAILEAVACLVYIYLIRIQRLMEWEVKYAKKFAARVRKLKLISGTTITIASLGILLIVWKTGIFSYFDLFQEKLIGILSMQRERTPANIPKPTTTPPPPQETNYDMLKQLGGKENNNPFIIFFMKLLEIAITLIAIAAVLYLLWMLFLKLRELYRGFYRKTPESYEKREIIITTEDITKDISDRFKTIRRDIEGFFDRSNEKRIRKIYYKLVSHYKSIGIEVVSSTTPVEIETDINRKASRDIHDATRLYEKARYSNEECSDEDVEKMKKFNK